MGRWRVEKGGGERRRLWVRERERGKLEEERRLMVCNI